MRIYSLIAAVLLLTPLSAYAVSPYTDAEHNLGLVFPEHVGIAVLDEAMHVSLDTVDIVYKIQNTGSKDIDPVIILTFPDVGLEDNINAGFVKAGKELFAYSLDANGTPVHLEKDITATYSPPMDGEEADMVKELAAYGITVSDDIPAMMKAINALPLEQKKRLAALGHMTFAEKTKIQKVGHPLPAVADTEPDSLEFASTVSVTIKYHWKQPLAAGQILTLHLRYHPSVASTTEQIEGFPSWNAITLNPIFSVLQEHPPSLSDTMLYCMNEATKQQIAAKIQAVKRADQALEKSGTFDKELHAPSHLNEAAGNYATKILVSRMGFTVQKIPVGHFTLTFQKNAPDDVVATCFNPPVALPNDGNLTESAEQDNYIRKARYNGDPWGIEILTIGKLCSVFNPALPKCPPTDWHGALLQ